jgi:hypothetical protein
VIAEVGDDGLVAHAVGGGDEFGVDRANEVDKPRGAQDPGLNADRTQRVLDVTVGRRGAGNVARAAPYSAAICSIDEGTKPGNSTTDSAELREARRRIKLLEQENEVLRRAAAYLSQALIVE